MKKILIVMLVMLSMFMITGCKKIEKIDKSVKVNTQLAEELSQISINKTKIFEGLDILNDNTLETQLGINRKYVDEYTIAINMYTTSEEIYIIIKPKEENKKIVKQALDLYIEQIINQTEDESIKTKYESTLKTEYKGYYIYIVSDDNEKVFNIIKEYFGK